MRCCGTGLGWLALDGAFEYAEVQERRDEFTCCGVRTRRFDDLMRIFLAGWPDLPFVVSRAHDHTRYDNRFHASYGWERVLLRMFTALAPHLKDGSSLLIDCDDGINECVVKDGRLVPA